MHQHLGDGTSFREHGQQPPPKFATRLQHPCLEFELVSVAKDRISELKVGVFNGAEYWPIVLGFLFVVIVLFLPEGIVGGLRKLLARFRRRDAKPAPVAAEGV